MTGYRVGRKKKKKRGAVKVDHQEAMIPPPSPALLLEIAVGIHLSVAGAASLDMEDTNVEWVHLPENVRQYWLEGARCAYSIIAIHGGADVIPIDNAE